MKSDGPPPTPDTLGFDPGLVLLKDSGALLDPRFLGALQGQIEERVGRHAAMPMLFQIGFLNGLRDAYQVLDAAFSETGAARPPATPTLAMRFRVRPAAAPPGALEVHGAWPDRNEAAARMARDGRASQCSCFLSAGYTSGWFSGTMEVDILAIETGCATTGAGECQFVAREVETWREAGDARAAAALESVSFDAFRELARAHAGEAGRDATQSGASMDRDAAVVHIWGPVMVVPYSGVDEALQAVQLIGSDPGARDVSVVVIDLGGAVLDEAFGALALERIVETAESWGAETLLAGVSPMAERVVDDLARPPLLVRKDLDEAIALAFQIARSQRADQ